MWSWGRTRAWRPPLALQPPLTSWLLDFAAAAGFAATALAAAAGFAAALVDRVAGFAAVARLVVDFAAVFRLAAGFRVVCAAAGFGAAAAAGEAARR